MNICFAAVLGCAALLAIAALAWGTASPAGHAFATGSDAAPEQFGDKGANGTTGPAGVQDDVGPDLDNGDPGADSDRGLGSATGLSGGRKGRRGDTRAPGAVDGSEHARGPPVAVVSVQSIGRGA